jgi:hypothetical protein
MFFEIICVLSLLVLTSRRCSVKIARSDIENARTRVYARTFQLVPDQGTGLEKGPRRVSAGRGQSCCVLVERVEIVGS